METDMTARTAVLVGTLALLIPMATAAQSIEQQTVDAQLATPTLDSRAIVTAVDLKSTPLRDGVAAIANAAGITVRYHSAVANLDALSDVKVSNAAVGDALQTVLAPKGLAFKTTSARSVFVYPNTPENREKYTDSVRTFAIAKADPAMLMTLVNRALKIGPDDLRPVIVTIRESRKISARATPETMALIARVIAENDK